MRELHVTCLRAAAACDFPRFSLKTRSLIAAIASTLLAAGCSTPLQMSVDADLQSRCAKDGGVHVYQRAERPNPKFRLVSREEQPNAPYYVDVSEQRLSQGAGTPVSSSYSFKRVLLRVVRAVDGTVMADSVSYVRFGGDLANPFHPTGTYCPHPAEGRQSLYEQLFGEAQR